MRLIKLDDLDKLQLSKPLLEADAEPFAILSHTWGDSEHELSLQDMVDISPHKHKTGFQKLRSFCQHAQQAGYKFAWAGTVCIDKTSSAELSEAINSMYRWYSISAVCYVFLEDLSSKTLPISYDELQKCRWFTRGWTLQELLAPKHVVFFDKNWDMIGTKEDLAVEIARITGIDYGTLAGHSVKRNSIARRMSWASQRKTSRPEDVAYCLLGIFGINMPMLYGEGERAFIRLQEEILRSSNDQSIFAWSLDPVDRTCSVSKSGFWSLLAPSPAYFKDSSKYMPFRGADHNIEHSVTSRGISLEVLTNLSETTFTLNCRVSAQPFLCTLPIVRLRSGPNEYARGDYPASPGIIPFAMVKDISKRTQIIVRKNVHEEDFADQYLINYMEIIRFPSLESGYNIVDFYPATRYDIESGIIFASPLPNEFCGAIICFKHNSDVCPPFMVTLFADSPKEDRDSISQDLVGVFSGLSPEDFFTQFDDWLGKYNQGDLPSAMGMLPGSVEKVVRGGLQVWKLDDSTFVRVSVWRKSGARADSTAVAEISAGTSWERDILSGHDTVIWSYL